MVTNDGELSAPGTSTGVGMTRVRRSRAGQNGEGHERLFRSATTGGTEATHE